MTTREILATILLAPVFILFGLWAGLMLWIALKCVPPDKEWV